ncbi:hypothetical protein GTV15_16250 [Streptomyces sp. SID7803]|nr:hypothetical protein [Streptomyces sp. SID7803]
MPFSLGMRARSSRSEVLALNQRGGAMGGRMQGAQRSLMAEPARGLPLSSSSTGSPVPDTSTSFFIAEASESFVVTRGGAGSTIWRTTVGGRPTAAGRGPRPPPGP